MPRKARKTKQELIELEGRIQCAINDLKNKKIPNPRQAALIYNLPPQTLYDRLKGLQSQAELRNHRHRLSLRQEEVLVAWIVSLDIRGAPPRQFQVRDMAQIILEADSSTPPQPVGKNWVTEFTKRRPEIKSRFARKINRQRALCEDPKVIGEWFAELQRVKAQWGIQGEDIHNFDETGFAMGLIATTKVVTRAEMPGIPWLIHQGTGSGLQLLNVSTLWGGQFPPLLSSRERSI